MEILASILPNLVKLADRLDHKGYTAEANIADDIIKNIHATLQSKAMDKEDSKEVCEEEPCDEKHMAPMKDENCMAPKDAEANLKLVQMRRRARRRRMLTKES